MVHTIYITHLTTVYFYLSIVILVILFHSVIILYVVNKEKKIQFDNNPKMKLYT